jgi:hypothetical protein
MSSSSPAFQSLLGLSLWFLILACEGKQKPEKFPNSVKSDREPLLTGFGITVSWLLSYQKHTLAY